MFDTSIIIGKPRLPISVQFKKKHSETIGRNNIDLNLCVGSPVVMLKGWDKHLKKAAKQANWSQSVAHIYNQFESIDGLVGYVTQYNNQNSVDQMITIYGNNIPTEPWVRVSFYWSLDDCKVNHIASVSLPAKSVLCINDSILDSMTDLHAQREMTRIASFNKSCSFNV